MFRHDGQQFERCAPWDVLPKRCKHLTPTNGPGGSSVHGRAPMILLMREIRRTIQIALVAFIALVAAIWIVPSAARGSLAENFGVGAFAVAAAAACVGVVRQTRGRPRLTWALFASGWLTFGLVYLIAGSDSLRSKRASDTQLVLMGSAVNAVVILAGIVLLYWAVRPERGAQGLIDASSLVLAVALGVWLWVVAPTLGDGIPIGSVGLTMAAMGPSLCFVAFGALGWVVLRRGRDAPAWMVALLIALLLQTAAGLLVLITSLNQAVPGGPLSALIHGATALGWVVAAQARSVGTAADTLGRRTPPPSWSRWLPFLIPVVMLLLLVPSSPPIVFVVLAGVALAAVRGISGVRVNNQLITERERLMVTDPLTGAFTRRHLSERLDGLIVRGGDSSLPVTIVAMDLDNFKGVNDSLGHAAGDRLLCELVGKWRDTLRQDDVLCRLGGDEFVIVLPSTPLEGAIICGERLRAIGDTVCEQIAPGLGAGVSCGLATMRRAGEDPDQLLARADAALYRAKANRTVLARSTAAEVPGRRRVDVTRSAEAARPGRDEVRRGGR